ncbi:MULTISPECIES: 50S ribosomal protein L32 [Bifidobacterium]|jgi:large subunit ribosomal protein L32|uniref:Large ribosomal subunit protein bL32 n=1 Tax=Bifidobacterium thermophilum RBL67 TaxID=1254439 RepID=M4RA55_9BIFI|nr:50S ribosomal protein L32 [Bifidobacterium thermophilum]AGH40356.1 50S ribosomal protein L32 [Bifidobacterium thermophilum RBL67]MDW8485820.1 50S ribosomal protein L32 [Bifidobacterium thermophilum]
MESEARLMATPKYRMSRSRTRSRRAHWKAKPEQPIEVTLPDGTVLQVPQRLAAAARRGYPLR